MNRLSIKDARMLANMTEQEACKAMNIKRTQLISWEYGNSIPSCEHAARMAEVYGLPLDMISFQKADNSVRFDTSALRSRIVKQYGTIKAFAAAVGMSPSVLGSRLNDHTQFRFSEIRKITTALNIKSYEMNNLFFREKSNSLIQILRMFLDVSDDQKRMLLAIMKAMVDDPERTKALLDMQ